ncbi:MAG TPA: response regulator transcription factor [Acidimicrobiales bacterium]|jgi:two-component system, OmpR family, response regulator|nr:response regulator transcription factor [Acidimicrobiales bacterium]
MRLLIADDDPEAVDVLRAALGRLGHAVDAVGDGKGALHLSAVVSYDAILLDVNLPPPDGFDVCRQLRAREQWTPVLFLTGRGDLADRVTGLDAGGDDYVTKPVSIDELEARLRALARRAPTGRPTVVEAGGIVVDPGNRSVRRDGVEISLTPKEFLLLEMLARNEGRAVSRSRLHEELWDFAFDARSNVIEALVRRLRAKVDEPFGRASIETVRGLGYRLNATR